MFCFGRLHFVYVFELNAIQIFNVNQCRCLKLNFQRFNKNLKFFRDSKIFRFFVKKPRKQDWHRDRHLLVKSAQWHQHPLAFYLGMVMPDQRRLRQRKLFAKQRNLLNENFILF